MPAGYAPGTTFHPTFLYESLWNLFLCGAADLASTAVRRPGRDRLFAMYVAGYTFVRFWIERHPHRPGQQDRGLCG